MAQQTAVDFLLSKVNGYSWGDVRIDIPKEIIDEAKEMERHQSIEFAKHCLNEALDTDIRTAHKYVEKDYNEIYGK